MSQASTAARARMTNAGSLAPAAVTPSLVPVPAYTPPTAAGARVTLAPRFPLIRPE